MQQGSPLVEKVLEYDQFIIGDHLPYLIRNEVGIFTGSTPGFRE